MKPTMTFSEFAENTKETSKVTESSAKGCMSESMVKKCNEMLESMCKEMADCHADDTERTAESYMKEASAKLNEMLEGLSANCSEYSN
jgi:hypothetical protein